MTDHPECKLTPEQREKYDVMCMVSYKQRLEDAVKELANEVQG